nr:accessory factor UbiK family protein [Pandoraea terrae]
MMKPNEILQDMQAKVSDLLKQSPAKDIERNVKSLLNQGFNRLDLVTREEFDIQAQVLARTREKLEALEKRVAELEGERHAQD